MCVEWVNCVCSWEWKAGAGGEKGRDVRMWFSVEQSSSIDDVLVPALCRNAAIPFDGTFAGGYLDCRA